MDGKERRGGGGGGEERGREGLREKRKGEGGQKRVTVMKEYGSMCSCGYHKHSLVRTKMELLSGVLMAVPMIHIASLTLEADDPLPQSHSTEELEGSGATATFVTNCDHMRHYKSERVYAELRSL